MSNAANVFILNIDDKEINMLKPASIADAKVLSVKIKHVAERKFATDFELCKWLYHAKNTFVSKDKVPFYEHCGYSSWEEFCEKHVCITSKKARKLTSVYERYAVELAPVFQDKHAIEISKMISLLPIINENNVIRLLEQAKTISSKDFSKMTLPKHMIGKHVVTFMYDKKHSKIKDQAFKTAVSKFGDLTDGEIFIKICETFIGKSGK